MTRSAVTPERRRELIVAFVGKFFTEHGYAPTMREVGRGVGLTSPSSTRHHLLHLRSAGELTWTDGIARSLRVVQQ